MPIHRWEGARGGNGTDHGALHGAIAAPRAGEHQDIHTARETRKMYALFSGEPGGGDVRFPTSRAVGVRGEIVLPS